MLYQTTHLGANETKLNSFILVTGATVTAAAVADVTRGATLIAVVTAIVVSKAITAFLGDFVALVRLMDRRTSWNRMRILTSYGGDGVLGGEGENADKMSNLNACP